MDLEQQILHIKTMIITAIINDNDFMGSEEIIEMVNKLERLIIQKQEEDKVEVMKLFGYNRKGFLYIDTGSHLISQQTISDESNMLNKYSTLKEFESC